MSREGQLSHSHPVQILSPIPPVAWDKEGQQSISMRKHQPGQESDGQTWSWCLDKVVQPRDTRYQKKACFNHQWSKEFLHLNIHFFAHLISVTCLRPKQIVVMSRTTHHKHETAPLSLYNQHTIALCLLSTGSWCLDKAVLAQGGGGGKGESWFYPHGRVAPRDHGCRALVPSSIQRAIDQQDPDWTATLTRIEYWDRAGGARNIM